MNIDKLKKKIAALRRKAESAGKIGSEAEAIAFAAKAAELMDRHDFTDADLPDEDGLYCSDVIAFSCVAEMDVYRVVANLYGCEILKWGRGVRICGLRRDVELAEFFLLAVRPGLRKAMRRTTEGLGYRTTRGKRRRRRP